MKGMTIYETESGKRFDTEKECMDYEALEDHVDVIMSELTPRPEGCNFTNGHGYIQHKPSVLRFVKVSLLKLVDIDHNWIRQTINEPDNCHISYAQRIIDEYHKYKPISKALWRIACVDDDFREWGQPYYANNPGEAKEKTCIS
jgi:hypothetical protein